jgi:hypothetical protein
MVSINLKGKKGVKKKEKDSPIKNCFVSAIHLPNRKKIKFLANLLILNLIITKKTLIK